MNTKNIINGLSILYPEVEFTIQRDALTWMDGPSKSLISDILADVGSDLMCNRKTHYRVFAERSISNPIVCSDHLPNVETRIIHKNEVIGGRCVLCRTGAPVLEITS